MRKNKKIIIIFSLILSLLFLNITPVYCATNINQYYILASANDYNNPDFILNNNTYTIKIHNNLNDDILSGTFNKKASYIDGKYYYSYKLDGNFSYNLDEIITYNILILDEYGYVKYSIDITNPSGYMTDFSEFEEYTPPTLDPDPTPDEEPTTPPDVIIDNTEVVAELKEIKSYLLMFYASFFMYFGYKIVKEVVNKQRR